MTALVIPCFAQPVAAAPSLRFALWTVAKFIGVVSLRPVLVPLLPFGTGCSPATTPSAT
jgi:hypothetical protein